MKKYALFIVAAILFLISSANVSAKINFKDVPKNFWAYKTIQNAIDLKIIDGYTDGTFRPNNNITEEEFLKLALLIQGNKDESLFEGKHWSDKYYQVMKNKNIRSLQGYNSINYRKVAIDRGQAIRIVVELVAGEQMDEVEAINYAFSNGLTLGKNETGITNIQKFAPRDKLTRAETLTFLNRAYGKQDDTCLPTEDIQSVQLFVDSNPYINRPVNEIIHIRDDVILAPLTFIYEVFNISEKQIIHDDVTNSVFIKGKNKVAITFDIKYIGVNKHLTMIDTLPEVINDEIYVPLEDIVHAFGGEVTKECGNKEIYIQTITSISNHPTKTGGGYAKSVPVLMYHHLLEDSVNNNFQNNASVISVQKFNEQMKILHDNGYQTITLQELEQFIHGKKNVPEKSVVITFDDGYYSNFYYGYKILKQYGFQANIFAVTSLIQKDSSSFNPDGLDYISTFDIDKYSDVFTIDSHTHDLHYMENGKSELVSQSYNTVKADLLKSKNIANTKYFAFPYGEYNNTTLKILNELGYTMAFTTKHGVAKVGTNKFSIPRYGIRHDTTTSQFKQMLNIK